MQPFLSIERIIVNYEGAPVLRDLSLEIGEGQYWVVTGGSGSGKTTLLETIAGKHPLAGGRILYHYRKGAGRELALVQHQHAFKNRYNLGEFYYQQRFNSADSEEAVLVRDFLEGCNPEEARRARIIEDLRLEYLLDKSLIKLSNGETRRLLFAEALLKEPRLLLLDAPFTGLDQASRQYFRSLIARIAASGITVLMACREAEIPEEAVHVARLEEGRLLGTWQRAASESEEGASPHPLVQERPANSAGLSGSARPAGAQASFSGNGAPLHDAQGELDQTLLKTLVEGHGPAHFEYAVRMKKVNVRYGEVSVLQDIDWEVRKGECWGLSGPNGAGKSTLLSLINADNPQAYANDILLFDRPRGSGESIWDIKKKIGFLSPELHQYLKTGDSCQDIVLSGLFDTLGLVRRPSPGQGEQAYAWLELMGIGEYAARPFRRTPLSTQRLVLLARALIKVPPLLILDEPCQGMDERQVQRIRELIDSVCALAGCTLIYVSHYREEIPSCVRHFLRLEGGRVV